MHGVGIENGKLCMTKKRGTEGREKYACTVHKDEKGCENAKVWVTKTCARASLQQIRFIFTIS